MDRCRRRDLLAALAGASVYFRPDRAIRVATGVVAHNVCSKTFVSGLDPQAVFAEITERDGIRRLRRVLRFAGRPHRADRRCVRGSGCLAAAPLFHEGLGCVLQHGASEPYVLKSDIEALKVPKTPPLLPEIAGPDMVQPSDPALKSRARPCLRGAGRAAVPKNQGGGRGA